MNKKDILVLGYFGYENNQLDGQTIKTREVYYLLKEKLNNKHLMYFDTQCLKTSKFFLFKMLYLVFRTNIIIYLPGYNNLNKFFVTLYNIGNLFRKEIILLAVGGWLPEIVQKKTKIRNYLKKIKFLGLETERMYKELGDLGFKNISKFPNFRIDKNTYNSPPRNNLKLVFMARICEEKGCETIFNFAKTINNKNYDITISFYGPVEESYHDRFFSNLKKYSFVSYEGIVPHKDTRAVLAKHDVLLLPTYYKGEGFPGSIIDAYMAGIPVIVSNWKDLPEFVKNGETGYVYNLDQEKEFRNYIFKLYQNKELLISMKKEALKESYYYSSDLAWDILKKIIYAKNR